MKLLICGDFTTCSRGKFSVKGNSALSESVLQVVRKCDVSIVNLEAPVANNPKNAISKYGPSLSTDPYTIEYLKRSGFDAVTLANNHFYDYGANGAKTTLETLENFSIKYVGGGIKQSVPLFFNNFCIFNYCESEFSVDHKYGSNKLDAIKAFYDISTAKNKGYNVMVIVHGGHEGYQLPSPRMKQLYRFFIDCGAKAVINHHQHCYSGYEDYNDGVIFYGLGNFFFDSIFPNTLDKWFEGFMVELDIEDNGISYKLHPYFQCKDNDVCVKMMVEDDKKSFFENIVHLNNIIADDKLLEIEFRKFIDTQEGNYLIQFTPYTSRVALALCRRKLLPSFINKQLKLRLMNAMRCEAHRDACIYLLGKY